MPLGYVCTKCQHLNTLATPHCEDCGETISPAVPGLVRFLAKLSGQPHPLRGKAVTQEIAQVVDSLGDGDVGIVPDIARAQVTDDVDEATIPSAAPIPVAPDKAAAAPVPVEPAVAFRAEGTPVFGSAAGGVITGGTADLIFRPPTIPPGEGLRQSDIVPRIISEEAAVERSENLICSKCNSLVHPGHKFCGKCGTPVEEFAAQRAPTQEFGPMQEVGKAKLVLIKGEGFDGISYHLNAKEHIAGRSEGQILFPDDQFLSPRHTNFFYDDGRLFLQDAGSVNGTYVRVREREPIQSGDLFLAGEEIFRFEELPPPDDTPDKEGTKFFASPMRTSRFRIIQILTGGREGLVYNAKREALVIGRERCDVNFPTDRYMSGSHVKIEAVDGGVFLVDMGSKNGTFLRVRDRRELHHGDYAFIGQQLLRVEITTF